MPIRLPLCLLICLGAARLLASDHSPIDRPFVHGLFSDHMVLQREATCPVWGWTTPGASVTVSVAGATAAATAGADGAWQARLGPLPAGGPHILTVAGPQQAVFSDVLVGDVWLCAGQSNMEMGVRGMTQWWNELGGEREPDGVRLAYVPRRSAAGPAATVPAPWRSARGGVADERPNHGGFSAVGFCFGRQIHRETGVPIGLIQAAWGATAIQSWSSPASLARQPDPPPADILAAFAGRYEAAWRKLDPAWEATRGWPTAAAGPEWRPIDLPQAWPQMDGRPFAGVAWFRCELALPAGWQGRELQLDLGTIRGSDSAWCNGTFLGAEGNDGQGRQGPRHYRIPAGACRDGRALIVVRVLGDGFQGGAPALRAAGEAPLPLTGWTCRTSTPMSAVSGRPPEVRDLPAGCYQAIIRPLAPFAIKGAIWYQGEGNAGDAHYRRRLTDLVADWRALFGVGDFPFLIVQLAGFGPRPSQPGDSGWARVREAQAQVAQGVPGCALAVAVDRGEIYDIHPGDKQDVGRRLALAALAGTYGQAVAGAGPSFTGLEREGSALRLRFDHAAGLKSLGGGPTGFAIAGADRAFVWAQARIDGETVVVSAPAVADPVAVRYGWADHPLCNLYSRDDLPLVPFRSDDW